MVDGLGLGESAEALAAAKEPAPQDQAAAEQGSSPEDPR